MAINIPNQITLARLGLAVLFFILLGIFSADRIDDYRWVLIVCFWVFLIAVASDVVDGYVARALKQETAFGRVIDPVVDKVIICGAFVYFAGADFHDKASGMNITGVQPWMVVVIVLREFLVSAIRSYSESLGHNFAASWAGKLKMFIQSAAICVVLGHLAWFPGLRPLALASVWIAVIATAASIIPYLYRARFTLHAGEPRRSLATDGKTP
jgi:CDP-diacylglycerol--glycerol-3-phosphate 3-phosphatidyltransferase